MATGMFENDSSGNCLQQPPAVPDSPDSIPLPDSPPPEPEETEELQGRMTDDNEPGQMLHNNSDNVANNASTSSSSSSPNFIANNNHGSSSGGPSGSSRSRKGTRKPTRLAEEYDPSEPLTSSDEEEHSLQLIEARTPDNNSGNRNTHKETNSGSSSSNSALDSNRSTSPKTSRRPTTPPPPSISAKSKPVTSSPRYSNEQRTSTTTSTSSISNSVSNNSKVDLSSIPVPPDENRRPVIHFSIPTRHRLLPISSLIKRQKGGVRRDGKDGSTGLQSDAAKAFGSDKSPSADDDDEEEDEDDGRPKISLVAEIFGSDDDNEEDNDGALQSTESQSKSSDQAETEPFQNSADTEKQLQSDNVIDPSSGRWKIVAAEPATVINTGESESTGEASKETVEQPSGSPPPASEEPAAVVDDEPEIIEIVTLNVPPPSSRGRPLRRRPFLGRFGFDNGGEPEVIDIDKDEEDECPPETITTAPTVSSPPRRSVPSPPRRSAPSPPRRSAPSPPRRSAPSPSRRSAPSPPRRSAPSPPRRTAPSPPRRSAPSPPRRSAPSPPRRSAPSPPRRSAPSPLRRSSSEPEVSTNINNSNSSNAEMSRDLPDSSPERERHFSFKRPHSSSSMSNCEEGEIVDQINPSKKRRKDKKRKTKKRKRSKDSISPSPKVGEKRLSDGPPPASSDNEDSKGNRSAISWRKPSKRSQNRNYRDGKPKADDTFFREKEAEEKQRSSSSPSHRRGRTLARKEKSPIKEKSNGRHRREGGSPRNRSHSKSPGKISRSRSRSSGKLHRSRRRNRHSRSKSSNSASDKSRSGRSTSRRRSRRRYRRSTSRHRVGDSRSPSYITEPIRSRSSHYSKLRDRSRSRSRDRHVRGRHRRRTMSPSKSLSPSSRGHTRKNKKPESLEHQQQRKKQVKEKQQKQELVPLFDLKDKKKEKEKIKEKDKRKKKDKPKEEPEKDKEKGKMKEKVKEKEKKKKKKRREKSPTPHKEIVADGDKIVVSLSFQKGKTASTTNVQSCASSEDRNENGLDGAELNSEPSTKSLSKVASDVPESGDLSEEPERSQNSPAKLSSVTDDEGTASPSEPCPTERSSKPSEEKETDAVKVTSSGGGSCDSGSPFETERSFSAAADSTKIVTPQQSEPRDSSSFSHSRASMSPNDVEFSAQGDSLVTSTGDSIEAPAVADDESSKSNSSSTPSKQADNSKTFTGLSHKITTTNLSPRFQGSGSSASTSENSAPSTATSFTSTSTAQGSAAAPTMTRPLIGNIPGLYPSSAIITSGGAAPVPPPIVIPTPPPPQGIRFPGAPAPMLNPNVLASVASALLAVRQNPPSFSHGKLPAVSGMSNSDNSSQLRHMNLLGGPRTQNFPISSNARSSSGGNFAQSQEGGDSPMSPNSSDGDDLFEPPIDQSQFNAANGGGKGMKVGQPLGSGPMDGNSNDTFNATGNLPNKSRDRPTLFDSLFGGSDPKKVGVPNKPEKNSKARPKHRKGANKKETIKVNTSGGLTEGELRLTDEVPTSAVELIVKQKYLKKLNRQERVVEEVKLSLKPYYSKRQINKDEYKDILRRTVPKICHNKTGEINPGKIKELVEAYVKKFRHARKRGDAK